MAAANGTVERYTLPGRRFTIRFMAKAIARDPVSRVREICISLPGTSEKLSHGEPTWFTAKRVYAMFSNNHHNDGHIAVWIPLEAGVQKSMVEEEPLKYYVPPYLGKAGWIGVELAKVDDEELGALLHGAWKLINEKGAKGKKRRLC